MISMEFALWTAAKANLPSGVTAMLSVSAGKEMEVLTASKVLSMIETCAVVLLDTTVTAPGMVVAITFVPGETAIAWFPKRSLSASTMLTTPAPLLVDELVMNARLAKKVKLSRGFDEPPPPQETHPTAPIITSKI